MAEAVIHDPSSDIINRISYLENMISDTKLKILHFEQLLSEEYNWALKYKLIKGINEIPHSFFVGLFKDDLCEIIQNLLLNIDNEISNYKDNPDINNDLIFMKKPVYFTRQKRIPRTKARMKTSFEMASEIVCKTKYKNLYEFYRINRQYFKKYSLFQKHALDYFSIKKYKLLFDNNIVFTLLLIMQRLDIIPPEIVTMVILPMCNNLDLCFLE